MAMRSLAKALAFGCVFSLVLLANMDCAESTGKFCRCKPMEAAVASDFSVVFMHAVWKSDGGGAPAVYYMALVPTDAVGVYQQPGGGTVPYNWVPNTWLCVCDRRYNPAFCDMFTDNNPHLVGVTAYWYDGYCVIPEIYGIDPPQWDCVDAQPANPLC
jgi:hypothetical protein